ncbi:hypothetical protein WR25_18774 [Diploscapter pachys]|uniref:Major facilitator superfamily (MFS) profile domain-containing protein n=1 Tax=Diploscapter pachys TaxID=2018661 RepID=A0A2A2JQN5_9BILA|nr:hypothetical protein WR25_18774 [Diploscapter pachys]
MAVDREAIVPLRTEQRVPEGHLTGPLVLAVFAVTLSSFQFGYHIGCINAPAELVKGWFGDSHSKLFGTKLTDNDIDFAWSVAVSIFAIGGMIGGLLSGWAADKVGRRGALLYNNIICFIAAALMGLAKSAGAYPMIILGRFFIGLNCGLILSLAGLSFVCFLFSEFRLRRERRRLSSGLVPMYLTEVSPINLRGMLGSIHQLLVTIAILVSQILGLPQLFGHENGWSWIFAFTVVPAIIQLAVLPLCPESPKYSMAVRGQNEKAEADLKKLRGTNEVQAEIEQMREEVAAASREEKPSMGAMFKGSLRWPMIIAIMMMLAQQLSGINVAMFYSTTIFKGAGLSATGAVYATIGMGLVNVIMTIIAVWLVDHPKFGRRSLLLIGLIGMWISTILIVIFLTISEETKIPSKIPGQEPDFNPDYRWASYSAIVFVLLFVISFATGPGAIPWFYVSEIFASSARGNANSIAICVNWLANFLVGLAFLPIKNIIEQYSFLVFTGFLTYFIFFTRKFAPETKGKTVEEITAGFEKNRR